MSIDNDMIFCTLFDSNYLDKGLALYHSMVKHIENFKIYIFAFDNECYEILSDMHMNRAVIIPLKDIMDDRLKRVKGKRTKAEFCWTCASVIVDFVLCQYQEKVCTYIDADIYFFSSPEKAIQEIKEHGCSVGITPHGFEKGYDNVRPMLINGRYCVQFNTFFNNNDGLSVLKKWKEDCLNWCYHRYEDGKLGDQKYLDTWKMKYSCVYEFDTPGIGMAPWNIHLYSYDGKKDGTIWIGYENKSYPIVFYHFEAIKFFDDKSVFLNLWEYNSAHIDRNVKKIYREYLYEIQAARKYLDNFYGITFAHMQIHKREFLKKQYSLRQLCFYRGILRGLTEWINFRKNNIMRSLR